VPYNEGFRGVPRDVRISKDDSHRDLGSHLEPGAMMDAATKAIACEGPSRNKPLAAIDPPIAIRARKFDVIRMLCRSPLSISSHTDYHRWRLSAADVKHLPAASERPV
jgi:hypothetical protein